jgi:hypothetical protein
MVSMQRAYFIYTSYHREEIKKQHPELSVAHVNRELGKMWRELDDSVKSFYISLQEKREKLERIRIDKLLNSLTHEERKEFIRIQILLLTKRKQN